MKANFKIKNSKNFEIKKKEIQNNRKENVSEDEFEDFILKAGAAGSFMVFRSDRKKKDELGLDEL